MVTIMKQIRGILFVLIGPSGVGKTTLARSVAARCECAERLQLVCTYTTRPPRPGEIEGIDYHFISQGEFVKKLGEGFFLEHSTAYNAYYGVPRATIMHAIAQGSAALLVIDRAGARHILSELPGAVVINIIPPNFEVLVERLEKRRTKKSDHDEFRIKKAREELDEETTEMLAAHTIVNDDLELACKELSGIINSELSGKVYVSKQ